MPGRSPDQKLKLLCERDSSGRILSVVDELYPANVVDRALARSPQRLTRECKRAKTVRPPYTPPKIKQAAQEVVGCIRLQPFVRESIRATRAVDVLDLGVRLAVSRLLATGQAVDGFHRPARGERYDSVELAGRPRQAQRLEGLPDAAHPAPPAGLPLVEVVSPRQFFGARRPSRVGEVGRHDVLGCEPHQEASHAVVVVPAADDGQQGEPAEQRDAYLQPWRFGTGGGRGVEERF